ncbi:MAG: Exonuclease small subunit [Planctomycetota bacterium]|jgi:exodeoxyribonuclease VII small subunit
MAKTPAPEVPAQPTFDERLQRLEALVVELEQGGGGLETALQRYAEGVKLLKECRESLAAHKRTVEELAAGGARRADEWETPAGGR